MKNKNKKPVAEVVKKPTVEVKKKAVEPSTKKQKQTVEQTKKEQPKPTAVEKKEEKKQPQQTVNGSVSKEQKSKELDNRTLFVKNLPGDITEEELKALSSDITAIRLKDAKTGKNKKKNKAQR